MPLSPAAVSEVRAALADVPRGGRTAAARALAQRFGVSTATVYRAAGVGGAKRPRQPQRPEYREWTRLAVQLAHRAPKPMPLDLALRAAVCAGLVPPEGLDMPLRTAMRIRREEGWTETRRRAERMHADWPMQALQFDGSTSDFLTVDGPAGDDWRLRRHRRPYSASGYKNKPLGSDRMRVVAYGVWDMCTGYRRAIYAVARGEGSLDSCAALCDMLAETGDPRRPLHGVPDALWVDQGALFRTAASRDLMERLGIEIVAGRPYQKERMGGVEQAWRRQWERFERVLFARGEDTILLSELNARLAEYEAHENGVRDSRTDVGDRRTTRSAAWTALVRSARPADRPLRRLPESPIETMAQEARRRVDVGGIVRWGGREYEVRDWHDRWVVARRPVDADAPDSIVVEDEETGETRVALPLARRPHGEVRARPATPLERLLEEDAPEIDADVWAPGAETEPKVVHLHAPAAPAAPLPNPLAPALAHPTPEAAMAAFEATYPWPLSAPNRAAVAARIEELGRDVRAVEELALALSAPDGQTAERS